jgi:hypothetical protein
VRSGRRAGEAQRGDAVRGRDGGRNETGEQRERDDVARALQRAVEAGPPQQVPADECLCGVADRDRARDADRDAARRVRDERAERDRRPELRPAQEERRDRDPGRRPDRRDDAVGDRKLETELRRPEVEARDRRDFDCLPRPLARQDADGAVRPLSELDVRRRTPSGRKVAPDLAGRQLPKG